MSLRLGLIGTAHVHAPSYADVTARIPEATFVGVWDDVPSRGREFCEKRGLEFFEDEGLLLEQCDAVMIATENMRHAEHIERAADLGKHILCEKPLAPTPEHAERIRDAVVRNGVTLMTAFPCPFAPAFESLCARVSSGALGRVLAVNATNHGRCPFGWFVEPELSGGGAMVDHVVHAADLLRRLLGENASEVYAVTGNNVYGQEWEDSALVTVSFPSGVFATIDSSWSRPSSYKTWGDLTLKVVCEKGLAELDLFGGAIEVYGEGKPNHSSSGFGSNLDKMMIAEFVDAVSSGRTPRVTEEDGRRASMIAVAAYESARTGQPVAL